MIKELESIVNTTRVVTNRLQSKVERFCSLAERVNGVNVETTATHRRTVGVSKRTV